MYDYVTLSFIIFPRIIGAKKLFIVDYDDHIGSCIKYKCTRNCCTMNTHRTSTEVKEQTITSIPEAFGSPLKITRLSH